MARWFVDRSPQKGIPSVNLRRLLSDARFVGESDGEVSGCSADSRRLEPGHWFVAIRGERHDGHDFVGDALNQGAAGVLVERESAEAGALQVVVPDTRSAHARIVHALAGDPSSRLEVVAIAGSRAESVASLFLKAILDVANVRCGKMGPSGWSDGLGTKPISGEVPGAEAVASMLSAIVQRNGRAALLELNEAGLADAGLLEGVRIQTALVAHVAGEQAVEDVASRRARRRLLARLVRRVAPGGTVVVNADDPDAEILGATNLEARRVTFGLNPSADVSGLVESTDGDETTFRLRGLGAERRVRLRVAGLDHLREALAASAVAMTMGIDAADVVAGLESVVGLPGRFEPVDEGQAFEVRVDQGRTPFELARALQELRSLRPDGRIVCVVGAEGQGDPEFRRALATAAESGADQVLFTCDNPRSEDPERIFSDLLSGCRRPDRVMIEPDRRRAIETALSLAGPGDGVLIAGKGRQGYQILADRVVPFDDRAVAARALRTLRPAARRHSA